MYALCKTYKRLPQILSLESCLLQTTKTPKAKACMMDLETEAFTLLPEMCIFFDNSFYPQLLQRHLPFEKSNMNFPWSPGFLSLHSKSNATISAVQTKHVTCESGFKSVLSFLIDEIFVIWVLMWQNISYCSYTLMFSLKVQNLCSKYNLTKENCLLSFPRRLEVNIEVHHNSINFSFSCSILMLFLKLINSSMLSTD